MTTPLSALLPLQAGHWHFWQVLSPHFWWCFFLQQSHPANKSAAKSAAQTETINDFFFIGIQRFYERGVMPIRSSSVSSAGFCLIFFSRGPRFFFKENRFTPKNHEIPLFMKGTGVQKWRRERDSNPRRLSPQRFSRPPQSTALPSLRVLGVNLKVSRFGMQGFCCA